MFSPLDHKRFNFPIRVTGRSYLVYWVGLAMVHKKKPWVLCRKDSGFADKGMFLTFLFKPFGLFSAPKSRPDTL